MPWHRSPSLTEICKENPAQADDCIRLHAPSSEGCGARSHQVDAWGSAEHPKALGYLRASAPRVLPPPRTAAEGSPLPEPRKIILLSFTDSFQPSQARRGCKSGTNPCDMLSKEFSTTKTSEAASGVGDMSRFVTSSRSFYHAEVFIIIAWVHLIKFINLSQNIPWPEKRRFAQILSNTQSANDKLLTTKALGCQSIRKRAGEKHLEKRQGDARRQSRLTNFIRVITVQKHLCLQKII